MTRALVVSLVGPLLALPLSAQHQTVQPPGGWPRALAHWGKWATAAAAAAFTGMAAHEHARSSAHWDRLLALCRADGAQCVVGPDGRYVNAEAEDEYRRSAHYDRRARSRLLAGQAALLVTVGLFLLDRRPGTDGPDNIPLAPLTVSGDLRMGVARVGVRVGL